MKQMIKPYGGMLNDGKIQVSFTLPCRLSESSKEAALHFASKMGLKNSLIVHQKQLSDDFTFFIIYGELDETYEVEDSDTLIKSYEVDELKSILKSLNKPLVVVGATTGTDAHTVGLDAIINMKGINGHKGLESYPNIICYNLGAQVENKTLLEKARKVDADFILVSQTVTQNDCHILNLRELKRIWQSDYSDCKFKIYIGGARITNKLAKQEGFDKGFGAGTLPEDTVIQMLKDKNLI